MANETDIPPFKLNFDGAAQPPQNKDIPPFALEGIGKEPTLQADIGRGAVSGLERGVVGLPGLISGIASFPEVVTGYAALGGMLAGEKLGLLPEGTYEKGKQSVEAMRQLAPTEAERKGYVDRIAGVPIATSSGMIKYAEEKGVPFVQRPTTMPGKVVEAGAEAVPAAIAGPGGVTERLASQFASGAVGELAGQATEGTAYEPFARLVGSIGGALPVTASAAVLRGRGATQAAERAGQIAGQVQREAFVNPAEAAKKLAELPPDFVKGVEPTTAQELQAKGATQTASQAQSLAREVLSSEELKNTPEADAVRRQLEASEQSLAAEAQKRADLADINIGPAKDVTTSFGIAGVNPQGEASSNVRNYITTLEKTLDKRASDAWQVPELQSAGVYKNKAVAQIRDYLDNLTEAKRTSFPSQLNTILNRIEALPGSQVSFQELQDLRSAALRAARKAYLSPEPVDAPSLYGFANRIGDVLSDQSNIRFGDVAGAIPAWENARAATRQYYNVFGDGFLGSMVDNPNVSPEMTLNRLYGGASGPNNLRELRGVFGPLADKEVSDWMVGQMTNNGSKINIKPEDVQKFLANPKNAAMISEVPGLDQRLQSIAQRAGETADQAQMRQFSDRFTEVINKNNPRALADFLDKHQNMIDRVFTNPVERDYVKQLENSARALQKIPVTPIASDETLRKLLDNNMFTLLYGRATGTIADAVAGELAGKALEAATGFTAAGPIGAGLSVFGVGKKIAGSLYDTMNNLVFGGTRDQAIKLLQEASRNPTLAAALMNKPGPNGWRELAEGLKNVGVRTAVPVLEQQRTERKSGGRISATENAASALVREANRAKNMISNHTERMLSLPDDTVVHALSIAKKIM